MSKPEVKFEPILHQEETPPIEYFDLDKKLNRRQQVFVWTIVNNPQLQKDLATKMLDSRHTNL